MYWILATIFIVIALAVPRYRPVGIVGCVLLGAMLTWAVVQRLRVPADDDGPQVQQRGRPTSPAAVLQIIMPDQVRVDDLTMSGGGAPFELRGRIENKSEALLKSITLLVTRRDCYEGALDPTGCAVVWQDKHWISIVVPPGESRDFSSQVWMRGAAPRVRGTLKDSFEIVAASGEIPPPATKADQ
ncbi:hypothetical protein [Steroidobacter agaridevorans]|uniref:hypothetical protein n=1 Tax=Steroidobacter agaridevorans TaxID=2695856 RepID=UPI00132516C1|nr:hypothetical protein [Steroidobacter agaridevorans]GFE87865.1 hypothetical protein GCM10011488_28190 [Steroidobacter agaridevorans]